MNLIERVKNILITPKTEWNAIESESDTLSSVITKYVLPLALAGAACTFIGYAFMGVDLGFFRMKGMDWGIKMAIISIASSILSVVIASFVVDALAPSFQSEKNINKSAQLVAYGYTPAFVGALFTIFPSIAILGSLLSLYGIYLMYLGLGPLKKTPEDKKVVYLIVTIVVLLVVYMVIGLILGGILGTRPSAVSLSL